MGPGSTDNLIHMSQDLGNLLKLHKIKNVKEKCLIERAQLALKLAVQIIK